MQVQVLALVLVLVLQSGLVMLLVLALCVLLGASPARAPALARRQQAAAELPRLRALAPAGKHIGAAMHFDSVSTARPDGEVYAAIQAA